MPSKNYIYSFILILTFFIGTIVHANSININNIINSNDNIITYDNKLHINNKKDQLIYSPIEGSLKNIGNKTLIYNNAKNIIIEYTGIKAFELESISKKEVIGVAEGEYSLEVFINGISQGENLSTIIYKNSIQEKLDNNEIKNIKINKKKYLNIYEYKPYYNKNYNKFFTALNDYAKNSLISEKELLLYKLFTEDKFENIVNKYENNELTIANYSFEEQERFNGLKNYINNIYINTNTIQYESEGLQNYSYEENILLEVISNIYGGMYIPEDKEYMRNILNKNKTFENINIGQYKLGRYNHNILKLADWKVKYYKDKNIDKNMFLTLAAINNQECPLENGMCHNGADAGPFQINQIHRTEFNTASSKITEFKNIDNLETKEKLKEDLFNMQLDWTINRLNRLSKVFCQGKTGDNLTRCMAILHNGNNAKNCYRYGEWVEHKYCYADGVVKIKNFLINTYSI